ncbi:MAG: 3-oxoacyl-ACP reductase FabG [Rhodocyclales bacterium]|nr:3-oxoacyl-ACP reductase FabG [Rhodocyclales bacterium]
MANRIALVTGAMGGLGTAICKALSREGFTVAANCLPNFPPRDEWLARMKAEGFDFVVAEADVSNNDSCAEMVKKLEAEVGPIDVLVNNAGITRDNLAMRMKDDEWDLVIETNLKSVFRLSKLVMRGMMKARHGRIINISSVVGEGGNAGQVNYAAAKAGVAGMSRALAQELGSRNITVNCVAPGFIDTDMTRGLSDVQRDALLSKIPLGRLGQPDEIAATVVFLASEHAGYITGSTVHVNGGMYMT